MPTETKRLYTLDEVKAFTQYFRTQGVLEFSVGETVTVRFGPAAFMDASPVDQSALDPDEMNESKLEFIKQSLAQATKDADEAEFWST